MPFTAQPQGDVVVVTIHTKRLDAHLAPEFKDRLLQLVQSGHERIIMDMTVLEAIDSSGLGALIAGLKALGGRGEMVLCGITPRLLSLLQLTHVDKLFHMFESVEEAVGELVASA